MDDIEQLTLLLAGAFLAGLGLGLLLGKLWLWRRVRRRLERQAHRVGTLQAQLRALASLRQPERDLSGWLAAYQREMAADGRRPVTAWPE